jgi:hypothetical protein
MRYSQFFIVLMAITWVFLPLSQTNRILFLGIIAIYLALHNFLCYLWAQKGKITLKKYDQMKKRMGEKWGSPAYLIFFVFLPLALGLYITVTSIMIKMTY